MKELSLNILDIAMNSVKAGANLIRLSLREEDHILTVIIEDNGCGMDRETAERIIDPFYTTRTTRRVGLGVPFYLMAARQTGGDVIITSQQGERHGTRVTATFHTDSIDCMPLGDMISTVLTLIQGNPDIDLEYSHNTESLSVELSTAQIKGVMNGIPIDTPEVLAWIKDYLTEQYGGKL